MNAPALPPTAPATPHATPYAGLPDHCFWSRAHRRPAAEVDPVVSAGFRLTPDMAIATAGSCFAQHIARHLQGQGYNYLVTEAAHPAIDPVVARRCNYGTFTARFGNLYTARQLLQLVQRATGAFTPAEDPWVLPDGRLVDPFRPNVQPGGFANRAEFDADRATHLAAVRAMLARADVFVFTFGLTEGWRSRADGAVFPLAPGVAGGTWDPGAYEFVNFTVDEMVADFVAFAAILRAANPAARILMTVSPVPLIATARADESVIAATAYSKAVLRVAAEALRARVPDCHYFPSYEVITGISARGAYYGADLREIEAAGVAHVMRLFMRHYAEAAAARARSRAANAPDVPDAAFRDDVGAALDLICDEELIEARKSVRTDP